MSLCPFSPIPHCTEFSFFWDFMRSSHFSCRTPKLHIWASLCLSKMSPFSDWSYVSLMRKAWSDMDIHSERGTVWDFLPSAVLNLDPSLKNTAWAVHLQHLALPSTEPLVPLHLHLALVPLEGTVCLEMKFFKFHHLFLWGLLFLLLLTLEGFSFLCASVFVWAPVFL